MKHLRILLTTAWILVACHALPAQTGIQFETGTFAEAFQKATTTNKPLFVDAVTSWCGPCKWMAANAFVDPAVAEYVNARFVSIQLDMEKGEGPDLAKKYNIHVYPTLLVLDAQGRMIEKTVGARGTEDFLKWAKGMAEPDYARYNVMEARFAEGDRTKAFLHDYILRRYHAGESTDSAVGLYSKWMEGAGLLEEGNWQIFDYVYQSTDNAPFRYVMANRPAFEAKFGKDKVQTKLENCYRGEFFKALYGADPASAKPKIEVAAASGIFNAGRLAELWLAYYMQLEDWDNYIATASAIEGNDMSTALVLNNAAWMVYEQYEDKKVLKKALAWVDRSIAIEPTYANLDTKAMIQHKMGDVKGATATAKAAIEKAKAEGEDYKLTQDALDSWKNP